MKKILTFLTAGLITSAHCMAQGTNQDAVAVMVPITKLFTGMNLGDSAMVHQTFASQVSLTSLSVSKEGKSVVVTEGPERFLKAVGTPHEATWSEPIWDVKVNIDRNFAQVWAQYAFYVGKTFSHCGVDAFHLAKQDDGQWKIFHLADTRSKQGCTIPPTVSAMFK